MLKCLLTYCDIAMTFWTLDIIENNIYIFMYVCMREYPKPTLGVAHTPNQHWESSKNKEKQGEERSIIYPTNGSLGS